MRIRAVWARPSSAETVPTPYLSALLGRSAGFHRTSSRRMALLFSSGGLFAVRALNPFDEDWRGCAVLLYRDPGNEIASRLGLFEAAALVDGA